jgi:hypothetical protein
VRSLHVGGLCNFTAKTIIIFSLLFSKKILSLCVVSTELQL